MIEKEDHSRSTNQPPRSKTRKYNNSYLALGFTVNTVGDEERPVCVLCLKTLAGDSMKPNKLKRHLETLHHSYRSKPLEFFQKKLDDYRKQESQLKKTSIDYQ